MTKQEFDEFYVGVQRVVHCATEELADEFLKEAHKHGYKWREGDSFFKKNNDGSYLEENNWEFYEDETCYDLHWGDLAGINYYKNYGYIVVEFNGFGENNQIMDELLENKIIKPLKRWKPKMGERYWIVEIGVDSGIVDYVWENNFDDIRLLKNYDVFKTKKEAESAYQEVLKTLKQAKKE